MATNLTKMGRNCDSVKEKLSYCVQTRPGEVNSHMKELSMISFGGGKLQILVSQRVSFRMEHASIFILGWK